MRAHISDFVHDKSDARIIEYGLIVAGIVIAMILAVQVVSWAFSS